MLRIATFRKTDSKQETGMGYTIDKVISGDFDAVEARVRAALVDAGFGVMTEINVAATLKTKIDVDMPAYKILGACNPKLAHGVITLEPKVGVMLPCNVVLREVAGGVEVSAVDPVASMAGIDNPALHDDLAKVRQMLTDMIAAI